MKFARPLPVSARPASLGYWLSKFVQRHRWAVAAAGLGALGLLLGLAAALLQERPLAVLGVLGLAAGLALALAQARQAAQARDLAQGHLLRARAIARDVVERHAQAIQYLPGGATLQARMLGDLIEHLRNLLPAHLMKAMDGFFSQARQNLDPLGPPSLEREWPAKVRVVATSQPLLPPKIDPAVFEIVCEALYGNRYLDVTYKNASGHVTSSRVMPLGLAQQGPRMYLICRFEGYEDNRALAIHRIKAAENSTLRFKRPKDFDLKKYDDEGRFGFGDGKRVRLSFQIEKEYGYFLLESKLSDDQVIEDFGDTYEVTATVVDSAMLEWWLRGFGEAVARVRKVPITVSTKKRVDV